MSSTNLLTLLRIFLQILKTKYLLMEIKYTLAAFRGGARVAGLICSSNSNIKGVIACGAAFPLPEDRSYWYIKVRLHWFCR